MNAREQLGFIINYYNLTEEKFADSLRLSKSAISNSKQRNSLSTELIKRIREKYPDINSVWLITGDGNPIITQNVLSEIDNTVNEIKNNLSKDTVFDSINKLLDIINNENKTKDKLADAVIKSSEALIINSDTLNKLIDKLNIKHEIEETKSKKAI